jgi:hypothetical protein
MKLFLLATVDEDYTNYDTHVVLMRISKVILTLGKSLNVSQNIPVNLSFEPYFYFICIPKRNEIVSSNA